MHHITRFRERSKKRCSRQLLLCITHPSLTTRKGTRDAHGGIAFGMTLHDHTLEVLLGRGELKYVYRDQATAGGLPLDAVDLLHHLKQTARAHLHLLTNLTQTIQTYTILAETLIKQSSTFVQGLHQSSVSVLQVAEHVTALAWLAEQRAEEVHTLLLPESPASPQPTTSASLHATHAKGQPPSTATPLPRFFSESIKALSSSFI
jgi:hypothetical protein